MTDVNIILNRLDRVKKYGDSWRAACPAHGGKDQNLKISSTPEGHILLKCFSHGCSVEDIVSSVGLTLQDIMPESRNDETIKSKHNLLSHGEGMRLIKFESQVVVATAYALRSGKYSPDDISRLETAMNRILNVMKACGL